MRIEEFFGLDTCLLEDGAQSAFGHIAGMIGDGGVAVAGRIDPDFMRARSLAVEFEAKCFESSDDLALFETSQAPHQAFTIIG
jgi:hypothetical protein